MTQKISSPIVADIFIGQRKAKRTFLSQTSTINRALSSREDIRQVGVKVGVGVGMLGHINKQLAGINHVALSDDGVGHHLAGHILVGHLGIMHLVVAVLDILAKVFADKSVEKGA